MQGMQRVWRLVGTDVLGTMEVDGVGLVTFTPCNGADLEPVRVPLGDLTPTHFKLPDGCVPERKGRFALEDLSIGRFALEVPAESVVAVEERPSRGTVRIVFRGLVAAGFPKWMAGEEALTRLVLTDEGLSSVLIPAVEKAPADR